MEQRRKGKKRNTMQRRKEMYRKWKRKWVLKVVLTFVSSSQFFIPIPSRSAICFFVGFLALAAAIFAEDAEIADDDEEDEEDDDEDDDEEEDPRFRLLFDMRLEDME